VVIFQSLKLLLRELVIDKLSQMYIGRNDLLMAHPPADDWRGIWVMEDK